MGYQDLLRGHKDYPIKAHFYMPIYDNNKMTHYKSDDMEELWCYVAKKNFATEIIKAGNMRTKHTQGEIETMGLYDDTINCDWLVEVEGVEYIIDSISYQDVEEQQNYTNKPQRKTIFKVRC